VRHHSARVRSAIVPDMDLMARAARPFALIIPGAAQVFESAEIESARHWAAGASS
jgi:hypothetical protein